MESAAFAELLPWRGELPQKGSLEARFVKACDLLQLGLKAEAYCAAGWPLATDLRARGDVPETIAEFPALAAVYRALVARSDDDNTKVPAR